LIGGKVGEGREGREEGKGGEGREEADRRGKLTALPAANFFSVAMMAPER